MQTENFNIRFKQFLSFNNLSISEKERIIFLPYKNYKSFKNIDTKFVVFEDWWVRKPEIIKSKITSVFGKSKIIYARQCEIRKTDKVSAFKFLNENHIYGSTVSKHQLGLFQNNELVAVATFAAQRRFISGKSAEMLRFCNKNFITVTGGLSKLINAYIKLYKPNDIMTYVDIDWGRGDAFKRLEFNEISRKKSIAVVVVMNLHYRF